MEDFKVSDLPELVIQTYNDLPTETIKAISSVMITMLYKA